MDPVVIAMEEAAERLKETNEAISQGGSEIQKFYEGSTVLVTGATGFMGKILVEKLLRACNVKMIYVLVRAKKGKTIAQRLDELKKDSIFDNLRKMQPNFGDKILPQDGNIANIGLGMSHQNWIHITEQVDMIFHLAATTRFDEALNISTLINVRGTREVLLLAKHCIKLKVLVHVSTAYSHATTDKLGVQLKEEFHTCPIPPDALIQLAEKVEVSRLEAITPELIKGWPNTYTFTKAVAEELVKNTDDDLPVCIIRPPVVIGTWYEPAAGWHDKDSLYGLGSVMLGSLMGIIRVFHAKKNDKLCLMPGDYVNNTILAAAWQCAMRTEGHIKDIKIYTISSSKYHIGLSTISNTLHINDMIKYSSPKALWCWYIYLVDNPLLYSVLFWILHYTPAYILDFVIYVFNISKPKEIKSFVKIYDKIKKMNHSLRYFERNDWDFDDSNVLDLHQKMSPLDQTVFNVDVSTINWGNIPFVWIMGLKQFVVKDSPKDTEYAIRKYNIFRFANYLCIVLYIITFYYICYLLYSLFKLF